jgi:site-specific DNA recombinase
VKRDHLAIQLSAKSERNGEAQACWQSVEQDELVHRDPHGLVVPWKKTPSRRPREIILPASTSSHPDPRPIRAETRAKLVTAIAKGRHWLDELIAGSVTNVEQIASTKNCTVRQVNMTISLAFLAPNLVQAAVDGRLPRGVGIANLRDAPAEWSLQYARLGLAP